jgi:hypothetical protein
MNMILNMTAAASNASSLGDNSAGRLDKVKQKLGVLGKQEAAGLSSRRDAGIALAAYAYDGDIDEGDAETCYDTYITSLGKNAAARHVATDTSNGRKANVSKFRQFIKMGALPQVDGREVLARAVVLTEQVASAGNKVKSPFDALLDVCRSQADQPDTALTDEQIVAAVSKPEPKQKDEMEKLVAAYKAAHKLAETIPSAHTLAAVDAYRDAIVEAGGEVPAMTKEEKEQAAFMAKAAKLGFVVAK